MSSNIGDLSKAATTNFLLNGQELQILKAQINFHEFRVFCTKPYHGRTNHASFTDQRAKSKPLFDYAMGNAGVPSNLCGALNYLPDDSSLTKTLDCNNLKPSPRLVSKRLYSFIWYVNVKTHITVNSKTRMDCDDYNSNAVSNDDYGTWYWYVR